MGPFQLGLFYDSDSSPASVKHLWTTWGGFYFPNTLKKKGGYEQWHSLNTILSTEQVAVILIDRKAKRHVPTFCVSLLYVFTWGDANKHSCCFPWALFHLEKLKAHLLESSRIFAFTTTLFVHNEQHFPLCERVLSDAALARFTLPPTKHAYSSLNTRRRDS